MSQWQIKRDDSSVGHNSFRFWQTKWNQVKPSPSPPSLTLHVSEARPVENVEKVSYKDCLTLLLLSGVVFSISSLSSCPQYWVQSDVLSVAAAVPGPVTVVSLSHSDHTSGNWSWARASSSLLSLNCCIARPWTFLALSLKVHQVILRNLTPRLEILPRIKWNWWRVEFKKYFIPRFIVIKLWCNKVQYKDTLCIPGVLENCSTWSSFSIRKIIIVEQKLTKASHSIQLHEVIEDLYQ